MSEAKQVDGLLVATSGEVSHEFFERKDANRVIFQPANKLPCSICSFNQIFYILQLISWKLDTTA